MTTQAGGDHPTQKQNQGANANPEPTDILMIGTFHFSNPGLHVVKTKSFDVLQQEVQDELEEISTAIAVFNPTQIFVEWPHDKQQELDALYKRYAKGTMDEAPRRNEVFQLGFRVAKKLALKKVWAVDYLDTSFPIGKVIKAIADAKQEALQATLNDRRKRDAAGHSDRIDSGATLRELLFWENEGQTRIANINFYTDLLT